MKYIFILLSIAVISSCSKNEGKGGNASITGTVNKILITSNGIAIDTIPAVNKDVFIQYGETDYYNDDNKTNEKGYFEFPFLRKGDYTVFAYSDCYSCASNKETKATTVTIDKKSEEIQVGLYIQKTVDYDDGNSTIKGRLMEQEFAGVFPINSPYPSQENEVYIVFGDDEVYFDRMDTGNDGMFEFKDLVKGTYTLYAYSQCETCTNELDTVAYEISITENNQLINGGDLTIEKR